MVSDKYGQSDQIFSFKIKRQATHVFPSDVEWIVDIDENATYRLLSTNNPVGNIRRTLVSVLEPCHSGSK